MATVDIHADIASLLWRLGLRDVQSLPWSAAQEHAKRHFPNGSNVFGELHLAMLAAAWKDRSALIASLERLRSMGESGNEAAPVAMRWTQALIGLLDSESESAREHLEACLDAAARLGGSNAQRGVVAETHAALRVPAV